MNSPSNSEKPPQRLSALAFSRCGGFSLLAKGFIPYLNQPRWGIGHIPTSIIRPIDPYKGFQYDKLFTILLILQGELYGLLAPLLSFCLDNEKSATVDHATDRTATLPVAV